MSKPMSNTQPEQVPYEQGAAVLLFRRAEEQVDRGVERAVRRAVHDRRVVLIDYVDSAGNGTRREVEPSGLLRGTDGWYLVGWCRLRGEGRAFRLDRISHAVVTEQAAVVRVIRDLVPDVPPGPAAG
jgi:predicted DNA-binding transcriptional regulator YafY